MRNTTRSSLPTTSSQTTNSRCRRSKRRLFSCDNVMRMQEIPEIILVNKPSGITSLDVIRRLRKKFGVRKMGHAGTLDPLAEGLMIIGIGAGTKKLADYLKLDKSYEAQIKLGERTDTGDIKGKIIE